MFLEDMHAHNLFCYVYILLNADNKSIYKKEQVIDTGLPFVRYVPYKS